MSYRRRDFRVHIIALLLPCAALLSTAGQEVSSTLLATPARSWAVDCSNNEALVIQHPNSYLRYRLHTVDGKGDQVRDQIETPDGTVSRLILRNGSPLTPQDDAAEKNRLNSLANSSSSFTRHIRHDNDNKNSGVALIRMMPDAMLWSYAPGQPQLPNHPGGDPALVVLDFQPNPKWPPPTFESELLTGLAGRVWIDPRTRYLVYLDAKSVRAVNIGWGLLAHIYPGGTAVLQQTNVSDQRWVMEHVAERFTVQALLVKSVKFQLTSDATDLQPVPAMSYQRAIKILLETPLPAH